MADVNQQIRALQVRVSKLETWAGPGQADALSAGVRGLRTDVADIRRVQRQHTGLLNALNRDVAGVKGDVGGLKSDVAGLKTDVAVLKTDVAGLKTDVAVLKTDVAGLKTDVAALKTDVAVLKADMADVKVTLAEILRRLPSPG
jgi:hypothetical protein